MTTYYLAFSPRSDLVGLEAASTSTIALPMPSSMARTCLHHGALETDFISFADNVFQETRRAGAALGRCMTSRTSSTLFFLSSGGLVVYLILRWRRKSSRERFSNPRPEASVRPQGGADSAARRFGDNFRSWLRWLLDDNLNFFQDADDGGNGQFFVEGQYFGPGDESSVLRQGFHFNVFAFPSSPGRIVNRSGGLALAPCPNCLKGSCKLKKHQTRQKHRQPLSSVAEAKSGGSSMGSSPKCSHSTPVNNNNSISATPYNADDEHSDLELEENLSYVNVSQTHRRKTPSKTRQQSSSQSPSRSRRRIPPEGREGHRLSANLSCGKPTCKDSFCLAQRVRCQRDEPADSLVGASGSMVDLVMGAREIRRLIRDTSMDSVASDFSMSMLGFHDELGSVVMSSCDELAGQSRMVVIAKGEDASSSDLEKLDGSSSDLPPKSLWLQKRTWRISAPMSDFDSPLHKTTTDDESNMEWESPNHGWHDLRRSKYKVALSRSQSAVTSDCDDNLDGWEWDSEGLGDDIFSASMTKSFAGHESWLPDSNALELDLESELGIVSRRNSCGSDVSLGSMRNQIRLPPSGCSSVTKGSSPCVGMTPSTSIDRDMMNLSLSSPLDSSFVLSRFANHSSGLRRTISGNSLCGRERNQYYSQRSSRWSSSSEESGVQDLERSFESASTGLNSSQHGSLSCAVTPLSPVHEAKEPRSSVPSPTEEKLTLVSTAFSSTSRSQLDNVRRKLAIDPTLNEMFPHAPLK